MTVSRALIDEELQCEIDAAPKTKTLVDEVFDEIKAEHRAYIEKVGFDQWFKELLERNSVPEPDMEESLDKIFAKIEEEERQKNAKALRKNLVA